MLLQFWTTNPILRIDYSIDTVTNYADERLQFIHPLIYGYMGSATSCCHYMPSEQELADCFSLSQQKLISGGWLIHIFSQF